MAAEVGWNSEIDGSLQVSGGLGRPVIAPQWEIRSGAWESGGFGGWGLLQMCVDGPQMVPGLQKAPGNAVDIIGCKAWTAGALKAPAATRCV